MKSLLLDYAPAILLWGAVLYKLPSWYRRPDDAGRKYLLLILFFLALAITVLIPAVYLEIDHLVGVPNFSRLLSNSLTLVDCWILQKLLAHLSGSKQNNADVYRSGLLLILCLVTMAALFLTAPVGQEALDFAQRYADAPHVLEYRLVFLFYLGVAEIDLIRLPWRYARAADHPSLRLGLRVLSIGGVFGTAYVINDGGFLILSRLGLPYPLSNSSIVDQILVAIALGLGAIGSTMPTWGPRVGIPRLYRWIVEYRSLRRLYPLWLALCRVSPEIAFYPPPGKFADRLVVRDLDLRLYRRIIEIRDGWLALRPYFDPEVALSAKRLAECRDLHGVDAVAATDAALLRAAIDAKERGAAHNPPTIEVGAPGGYDVAEEVAVLERIAWYFERSPIVHHAVERAGEKPGTQPTQLAGTE